MTRKPSNPKPAGGKTKCGRCGSTETRREGDHLVCDNCGAVVLRDRFKGWTQ